MNAIAQSLRTTLLNNKLNNRVSYWYGLVKKEYNLDHTVEKVLNTYNQLVKWT